MKYRLLAFIGLLTFGFAQSQTYEVGLILGGTNFSGDVGSTSFMNPKDYLHRNKGSFGAIFKWNRSTRHSFRFSYMRLRTFDDDLRSDNNAKIARGYFFNTDIDEFSVGIEYTFWEWDPHNHKSEIVPYLYTGPTFFLSHHHFLQGDQLTRGDRNTNFAIPMVIGLKMNFGDHFVIAGEFGARYTFTDNLDGSAPSELGDNNFPAFGNANTNDWYMFAGLVLTYSFGRKPCYCNF